MIVKRYLHPAKVARYTWRPMAWSLAATAIALAGVAVGFEQLAIPFLPVSTLGAALAIFLAFRNNTAYTRWWEARSLWAGITNAARNLARLVVASTQDALDSGTGGDPAEVLAARRDIVLRTIAFAHALRIQLRRMDDWSDVSRLVRADEYERIRTTPDPAYALLAVQSVQLKVAVRAGMLGSFDSIVLEPNVAALSAAAVNAERLKSTPTPRQYDFFTRLSVYIFIGLLPLGLLGALTPAIRWWTLPLSLLIAFVYVLLLRTAEIIDAPFENRITDVPLTAICTDIERDLLASLGERNLPPAEPVRDGYLW